MQSHIFNGLSNGPQTNVKRFHKAEKFCSDHVKKNADNDKKKKVTGAWEDDDIKQQK